MINWVPEKKINHDVVRKLLQESEKLNQFTNGGPNVQKLESFIRTILEIHDDKAIVAVTNATLGIHCAARAISNLTWATQSFTFPPSAQGTLNDTLILDVDQDGGISIPELEKVKDQISGVILTNIFGNVTDLDKYITWCKNNNKSLLLDNAATPFTFYKTKNSCNYGNASVISFHHTKPLGFGEGGAIIIDRKYEESLRAIINFGIDNNKSIDPANYWSPQGTNAKMSDISAVYIIQYLQNFDKIIVHHQYLLSYLQKILKNYNNIKMFPNFSQDLPFLSCFCLLSPNFSPDNIQKINKYGIFCRKYYIPLKNTPTATKIYENILCIPCTIDMTLDSIDTIVDVLRNILN